MRFVEFKNGDIVVEFAAELNVGEDFWNDAAYEIAASFVREDFEALFGK